MPKAADHTAVLALDDADFVAVGIRKKGLLGVRPDREIPHRAIAESSLLEEPLPEEGAVLGWQKDFLGDDADHTTPSDILVLISLDGCRLQYRSRVHIASPS
jgi:hypothetical protein